MDITELEDFKMSDAVKFHRNLNPELWTGTDLYPEVREQLIVIAEDFISYLGISDLDVQDITISGSNAAYSYTPHSDLDLHVVVDMSKLNNDAIYRELFTAKKTLYNDSHSITVHGVPVELYVQDANEPVKSLGEYSVLHDKWIHIPKKRRANFDEAATKAKFENLAEIVELALKTRDLERVEKTIDTIKRYRKAGLAKGGEFGPENLAFKAIRKQGGIQDLYDLRNRLRSDRLSIEEENKLLDKPEMTVAELAEKHGVSRMQIAQQLDKGIKVEMEHTSNKSAAREIALDHLAEDPVYYDKLAKVGLEEDSDQNMNLNEIGFADMLANLSLSDQEIIDNSTKAGTIGQTPVHIFKRGTSTLYFFATDTTILALVLLDRTYLKAIKNFTTEKGMVYSLLNYIVNIEGLHINIAPSEPFTQEGFSWLLRLANNTHGLRLSTTSGHTVDQAALKREWNNAKLTKEPGDTGLVISEMSNRWKSSIIENENSLMPFRIFEYTEILAEDSAYYDKLAKVNLAEDYDYSAWGYWILPDGQIIPVAYLSHDLVAKKQGFKDKEEMVASGAIRVTGSNISDVHSISHPNKKAVSSLAKLLKQVDRSDKIWFADETSGEFKGVTPRELVQKLSGTVTENTNNTRYDKEIEEFVQSLNPDDVGVEQIGPYHVHFEGFTDECQQDAERRCNLPSDNPQHLATYDDVYKEVISDFVRREGGKKPLKVGFAGYQDYPVIYAVFHNPEPYKNPDAWNPKIDEASVYIPSEPSVLYHVTPMTNISSIKQHGLLPTKSRGYSGVYLALDAAHALGYIGRHGETEFAILTIDVSRLDKSKLQPDDVDFPDMLEPDEFPLWYDRTWTESLYTSGQCKYDGVIPRSAIVSAKKANPLYEASGYIPSAKEKNDPRFKTALTVDVKPNSIKDTAAKLGLGNIKRTGVPQTANPNGKPKTK